MTKKKKKGRFLIVEYLSQKQREKKGGAERRNILKFGTALLPDIARLALSRLIPEE